MKTKTVAIQDRDNGSPAPTDDRVQLEHERIMKAFADVNFMYDMSCARRHVQFKYGLKPQDAKNLIVSAVPNGIGTFITSDIERLIETFENPLFYIGRDDGIIVKVKGEPIIDPFIIKCWVSAKDITIGEDSYIYTWKYKK